MVQLVGDPFPTTPPGGALPPDTASAKGTTTAPQDWWGWALSGMPSADWRKYVWNAASASVPRCYIEKRGDTLTLIYASNNHEAVRSLVESGNEASAD